VLFPSTSPRAAMRAAMGQRANSKPSWRYTPAVTNRHIMAEHETHLIEEA
jgi:hypothetical protein